MNLDLREATVITEEVKTVSTNTAEVIAPAKKELPYIGFKNVQTNGDDLHVVAKDGVQVLVTKHKSIGAFAIPKTMLDEANGYTDKSVTSVSTMGEPK